MGEKEISRSKHSLEKQTVAGLFNLEGSLLTDVLKLALIHRLRRLWLKKPG